MPPQPSPSHFTRINQTRVGRHGTAGFSLIELMVVTIIIGLLAAIAIPVFATLQAKAHHAETKANLSSIYVAESNFFAEQSRYGSFDELDFTLQGVSNRYTYRSPATGGTAGSSNTPNEDLIVPKGGIPTPDNTVAPSAARIPVPGSFVGFTATATGNLDNDGTLDQWHVNQDKQGLHNPDVNDADN